MAPVLVVQGAKSYGRRRVLRGVSFDLELGHFVGIVGENCAGKSTLLRILAAFSDEPLLRSVVAGVAYGSAFLALARFFYWLKMRIHR